VCRVIYRTEVIPRLLPAEVLSSAYPRGNYHTLYFGEILAAYGDEETRTGRG